MRKSVFVFTILFGIAMLSGVASAAKVRDIPLKLVINGKTVHFSAGAFMRGSKTYVPLYSTAKQLHVAVTYNAKRKVYTLTQGKTKHAIPVSQVVSVKGTTMADVTTLASALGCKSHVDAASKTVTLGAPTCASSTPARSVPCPPGGG